MRYVDPDKCDHDGMRRSDRDVDPRSGRICGKEWCADCGILLKEWEIPLPAIRPESTPAQ